MSRAASRLRPPLRFLAFPVLAGVLAACSGDVIGEFPSPPSPAITASPTPELDEGILAEIAVDGSPCFLAEAAGRVWVTSFDGNELHEVDPATNEVVRTYRMPGGPCGMVERGDGIIFVGGERRELAEAVHAGRPRAKRLLGHAGLHAIEVVAHRQHLTAALAHGQHALGVVLMELGRLDQAIEALSKSVEVDPRLADAHFHLGTALAEVRRCRRSRYPTPHTRTSAWRSITRRSTPRPSRHSGSR